MPQIDPKFTFWFGVWTNVLLLIASLGVDQAPHVVAQYAPTVQWFCMALYKINNAVLTGLVGLSSTQAGPLIKVPSLPTIVKILILAFAVSLLVGSGSAQAQSRRQQVDPFAQIVDKAKADFTKKTGVQATGDVPFDLLRALDAKLLPDLTYAKALADATGSKVTAACYGAWIDMINVQQTAVKTKNADGTPGDAMPVPDPHLITDFERAVELRNALQPDSPFMTACSPVANMIKQDVVQFMAAVVAGNVSIATLVPGF